MISLPLVPRLVLIAAGAMLPWVSVAPAHSRQPSPNVIPPAVALQLSAHIKRYLDRYEAENCGDRQPGEADTCRGSEYQAARRFRFGDLDGDGKDDLAVLYTLEGFCCSNDYQFFLAVFLGRDAGYTLAATENVGGKGERGVEFAGIGGGKIDLITEEYLPDDPMCCPTGKGRTAYLLTQGKLVESK